MTKSTAPQASPRMTDVSLLQDAEFKPIEQADVQRQLKLFAEFTETVRRKIFAAFS